MNNYLSAHTVRSWLGTTDHKRIGLLYMVSITLFFLIGGAAATLMRLELLTPQGDLVASDTYNRLFTLHGVVMVWFFLIPSIPTVLGNFLVPMMIGARDVAFPRLNLASWYLFMAGGAFAVYAIVAGGVDTGWTFYTPYSSAYANGHVIAMITGIFIAGFGSIATGLNFIVTIHTMRAPGLTWHRLPLFLWSMYATSIILVLATPVLAITLLLVGLERIFGIGIFDPALGGDPLLFQHLFWFYSHPAVYIMILPGMGVISEIIPCFSRQKIFGYHYVAYCSVAIAVLGFLVWGHHMFVSSQSVYAGMIFSVLSFLVSIPSAIKVFNWTATLYRGSIWFQTPLLYALGFVGLFTIGGLTGLFLAALAVDVHLTDTYFVIAHFHYIMVGGMVMAYLGGLHFWWPKISGRLYPEGAAKLSALFIFCGFNLTFFPQFLLGYLGMPRRYHTYAPEFQALNVLSTAGASILAIGYFLPLAYLLWSLKYGRKAGANPWQATGLEWTTPSPPPTENFEEVPVVIEEPYNYHPEAAYAPSEVAHQFEDAGQQLHADRVGMWFFLATEVLFFGGLFLGYTVYRVLYPHAFAEASRHTLVAIGAINTAVLLISSFLVALAVRGAEANQRKRVRNCLLGTAALGLLFLALKAFEYTKEIHEGLLPGAGFQFSGPEAAQARIFFSFYFVMTGLHAVHVTIGIVLLVVYALRRVSATAVELLGLYWHFVDIVWVFLFPLIYLIDRHP